MPPKWCTQCEYSGYAYTDIDDETIAVEWLVCNHECSGIEDIGRDVTKEDSIDFTPPAWCPLRGI